MGKVVTGVFGICLLVTGLVDVLMNVAANNIISGSIKPFVSLIRFNYLLS